MQGFLDNVTACSIRGWAADDTGEPSELVVAVNGQVISKFRCSVLREDLISFDRRDLGFELDLGQAFSLGDVVEVKDTNDRHVSGSPRKLKPSDFTKKEKALWLVRPGMKILEIGPSFDPIAPRSAGWNSYSLDHATQEELIRKYQGQQAIHKIEPVDFVWTNGPLHSAVPMRDHGSFDGIIVSHVLEHIPDPIAFFDSAACLLKEDGLISIVFPDKRVTFDYFKPITTTSDWLTAHHRGLTRHSKKTAFDSIACNVSEKHQIAWSVAACGEFNFMGHDVLTHAKKIFDETSEDPGTPYADYHASVCTPSSLSLVIFELNCLGIVPFEEACSFPVSGCEFYLTLRKRAQFVATSNEVKFERIRLMKSVIRELGEQARWLLDD